MQKRVNIILIFILLALSISLLSAYIIEYGLGYEPCKLCIYQRIPYVVSILLILNILFIKKFIKIALLVLTLVSLSGAALAFYHFGIEQGFLSETSVCEGQNLSDSLSKTDILNQLKQNTASCKEVNLRIFGLSLASINTIFSFVLFVIFMKLYKNYENN
tara:strand:+ start:684 stop:1163 length:480 start_codon:yes stop_codon:yes gene_type:complete